MSPGVTVLRDPGQVHRVNVGDYEYVVYHLVTKFFIFECTVFPTN